MFIELPNESRINIDKIVSYYVLEKDGEKTPSIYIDLVGASYEKIKCTSVEEANLILFALDRAAGIKPLMIKK